SSSRSRARRWRGVGGRIEARARDESAGASFLVPKQSLGTRGGNGPADKALALAPLTGRRYRPAAQEKAAARARTPPPPPGGAKPQEGSLPRLTPLRRFGIFAALTLLLSAAAAPTFSRPGVSPMTTTRVWLPLTLSLALHALFGLAVVLLPSGEWVQADGPVAA